MSISQETLSGFQSPEPIVGFEFGELFLGGIASTYFVRGRFSGYGFYFTDRRIIGLKMRRVALAVKAPFEAAIIALYLIIIFETLSGAAQLVSLLLPLVLHFANWPLTVLTRRISQNIISRKTADASKLMRQKRDFELRRNEIEELLMKSPSKRSLLEIRGTGGYLRITTKDFRVKPILVKVQAWKQHQKLRDLVIDFSSREPRVRAMEYPYGS